MRIPTAEIFQVEQKTPEAKFELGREEQEPPTAVAILGENRWGGWELTLYRPFQKLSASGRAALGGEVVVSKSE